MSQIEWIEIQWDQPAYGQVTIKLGEIAAEPAPPLPTATLPQELVDAFAAFGQSIPPHIQRAFSPPRQFAPSFSSEELLKIAAAQLPDPDQFLGRDVIIDGITPVAVAFYLSHPLRKARSLSVNVPREGGVKHVWARDPQNLDQLVPGDQITLSTDRRNATWRVQNVGNDQVNLVEQGRGRKGQTIWVRDGQDVAGWT
jgi:ribosomal 50S subunit-recycling heat shock protein